MARTPGSKAKPKTVGVPLEILFDYFNSNSLIPVDRQLAEILVKMGKTWDGMDETLLSDNDAVIPQLKPVVASTEPKTNVAKIDIPVAAPEPTISKVEPENKIGVKVFNWN